MHALAITAAQDRAVRDRHVVRAGDGVEILSPRREDQRAAAQRYEATANRRSELRVLHDAPRAWRRAAPAPGTDAGFLAQFMAQHQPANAAHVEDWRGARAAYARAGGLARSPGATLSILV